MKKKMYKIKYFSLFCIAYLGFLFLFSCSVPGGGDGASGGGGDEWSGIITVDSGDWVGENTSIAVNGSNVYISYYDDANDDLKLAKSTDSGITWTTANLDVDISGEESSIGVNDSNVYICYHTHGLDISRSTDGGVTWTKNNIEGSTSNIGFHPSIAVKGCNIYISYVNSTINSNDLMFARSTDSGNTWIINTVDSVDPLILYNSIDVSESNIYISYYEDINEDLKVAISRDGGDTWEIDTIESEGDVGRTSSIAVDGGNVYVSYSDATNDNLKIARSTDYGITWTIDTVDWFLNAGFCFCDSSIAVKGSNVYISYHHPSQLSLKFAKSIDGGNTW
jgi:hypothetical protein